MNPAYKTILCPTDFSATGNGALPVALGLAGRGSCVHLLAVIDAPTAVESPPLWGPGHHGEDVQVLTQRARAILQALLESRSVDDGVQTELHVEAGCDPARVIEDVAKRIGADLVVMGTHGRTGLGRLLLGSTAAEVMRRRNIPLLLLHDARTCVAQGRGVRPGAHA